MVDSSGPRCNRDRLALVCGEIAIGAIVSGAATALPAALRQSAFAHRSLMSFWIPMAGIAAACGVLAILLVRTATLGVRNLFPAKEKRASALVALSVWMVATSIGLAAFGALLSSVTHHRGLGATTFALVGIGLVALCAVVSWRFTKLLGSLVQRPAVAWGALLAAGVTVASMAFSARSASGLAPWVGDAVVFAGVVILTSRIRIADAKYKIWTLSAVGLFVVLIAVGMALQGRIDQTLAQAMAETKDPAVEPASSSIPSPNKAPSAALKASTERPHSPALSAGPPVEAPNRVDKPDFIVLTLDAVRADHLGSYGYKRKTSPHLDALASQSAVFERAYAAGPETRTAIAPLVTCKHLVESVRDQRKWPTLLRANETLAERLRAGGYATGAVSSFQWLSKARGFDQGFDLFDEHPFRRVHPEKGVTGAHAVAQAMQTYDKLLDTDKPLFLWVHMFDAHKAYNGHDSFDFGRQEVDHYDSEIAYMDKELSRLIEHVGKSKRARKTVWIVHGSHGEAFGEHGFRGHPPKFFDEVVRVPLMIKLPWAKPTRVKDAAVSVLDIPATVLSLAFGKVDDCTGKPIAALAEGMSDQVAGRPMLLVAYAGLHGQAPAYGWLNQHVKYVLYAWREGEKTRLFDLQADPEEKTDLQSKHPGQATELRKQLDSYLSGQLRTTKASPAD